VHVKSVVFALTKIEIVGYVHNVMMGKKKFYLSNLYSDATHICFVILFSHSQQE
jgi:hypothetical protein